MGREITELNKSGLREGRVGVILYTNKVRERNWPGLAILRDYTVTRGFSK